MVESNSSSCRTDKVNKPVNPHNINQMLRIEHGNTVLFYHYVNVSDKNKY